MKNSKSFSVNLLIMLFFFTLCSNVIAQKDKNISFQVAPLLSYMHIVYGPYSNKNLSGVNDPQLGFSSTLKFEISHNKTFSINTGLSYQIRNNKYEPGIFIDTLNTIYDEQHFPYKSTDCSVSYQFIGVPIGINVNYLNTSKLRIYQSFATELSFLFTARYKGVNYYKGGNTENYNIRHVEGNNKVLFSLTTSIAVCKYLNENFALKIEPGINYMANYFRNGTYAKMKFFDLKIDVGLIYKL